MYIICPDCGYKFSAVPTSNCPKCCPDEERSIDVGPQKYVSPYRCTQHHRIEPQVLDELLGILIPLSEDFGNRHFKGRGIVMRNLEKVIGDLIQANKIN